MKIQLVLAKAVNIDMLQYEINEYLNQGYKMDGPIECVVGFYVQKMSKAVNDEMRAN